MFGKELIPVNDDEFSNALRDNFHIFEDLQKVVESYEHPAGFGSYLMDGQSLAYTDVMYPKQKLLFDLVKNKTNVVEIGVNAGHSLLIMLLANPTATYDVIDICEKKYTQPCIEYLQKLFPGRINAYYGDSIHILTTMVGKKYDFWHIDGFHYEPHIINELKLLHEMGHQPSVIVLDDVFPSSSPVSFACSLYKDCEVEIIHPECKWPNTILKLI